MAEQRPRREPGLFPEFADFMANRIAEMIPRWRKRFDLHTLVINADNGPESNGHRTSC
jgi:hypothetical protein